MIVLPRGLMVYPALDQPKAFGQGEKQSGEPKFSLSVIWPHPRAMDAEDASLWQQMVEALTALAVSHCGVQKLSQTQRPPIRSGREKKIEAFPDDGFFAGVSAKYQPKVYHPDLTELAMAQMDPRQIAREIYNGRTVQVTAEPYFWPSFGGGVSLGLRGVHLLDYTPVIQVSDENPGEGFKPRQIQRPAGWDRPAGGQAAPAAASSSPAAASSAAPASGSAPADPWDEAAANASRTAAQGQQPVPAQQGGGYQDDIPF